MKGNQNTVRGAIRLSRMGAAILGAVMLLSLVQPTRRVSAFPSQEIRVLKRRQKEQRKTLKEQQRAMRRVMAQHQIEMSPDARSRFKQDLKLQRQMLLNRQKKERLILKRRPGLYSVVKPRAHKKLSTLHR